MRAYPKWSELDAVQVGLAVMTAMTNLEREEGGEIDLRLEVAPPRAADTMMREQAEGTSDRKGLWLRFSVDLVNKRVVIFEVEGV